MAYLLLYGTGGWTQRWQIADGEEDRVRAAISHVGRDGTGHLTIVDPGTETTTTLVVAWAAVAAAVVVDSDSGTPHAEGPGQYA
jgi:hypothetical protein